MWERWPATRGIVAVANRYTLLQVREVFGAGVLREFSSKDVYPSVPFELRGLPTLWCIKEVSIGGTRSGQHVFQFLHSG